MQAIYINYSQGSALPDCLSVLKPTFPLNMPPKKRTDLSRSKSSARKKQQLRETETLEQQQVRVKASRKNQQGLLHVRAHFFNWLQH